MLTAIEYIMEHDTVMICRCYGTGSYLTLPDEIAGYPVTALADHCFAPEPSYALRHVPKRLAVPSAEDGRWVEAVLPGTGQTMADEAAGGQPALCAKLLESISLPGHLKRIGNYAFYACHHLREIHFPASLENLGGGTFVAAYHLERFYFSKEKGQISPPCMKDVLGDYRYEIEVIAEDQPEHKAEGTEEKPQERTADLEDPGRESGQLRLVFPEYFEEAIENTPGREIQMEFHGTGYKYRQCFKGREIDLQKYDAWFYIASVQEFPPTILKMAFDRLCYPVQLSEESRAQYLSYLRREYRRTAAFVFGVSGAGSSRPAVDLLRLLDRQGYFSGEILDEFLRMAGKVQQAEAVSELLRIRWQRFPAGRRKYEL